MSILTVNGQILKKAIIAGANELAKNRAYIDSLNVFPVPDGDTGVNMSMTALAAAREVEKLNTENIHEVAKAAANGSLRGARGNSGVILSQLFRGFAKGLEGKSEADAEALSEAFVKAMEAAYKAVMKPKEGTILTIAKSLTESAMEAVLDGDEINAILGYMLEKSHQMLVKTQFMLPELKAAGVVDAGGRGLLYIIEGALASGDIKGEIKVNDLGAPSEAVEMPVFAGSSAADIKFAYCTEFFINIGKGSKTKTFEEVEDSLKDYLESIGDSTVIIGDDELIKIHVHTNNPGAVLEEALKIGELSSIKIENMKEQHSSMVNHQQSEQIEEDTADPKNIGFIAVSTGDGFKSLFKDLKVDEIIEGGQTMNPSTETFLSALDNVNAENIIIFPNNKNIILAAQQAAKLYKGKNVYVLPTESMPQGITSLISYIPDFGIEENLKQMRLVMSSVKTGLVTYAVRDTKLDGKEIKENDILCILENDIKHVEKDIIEGTKALIDTMLEHEPDIISIYYGQDQTEEEANIIAAYVEEKNPDCEAEVLNGGQPLYYYVISAE